MGLLSHFRRRNLDSPVGQRAFALSDPAELERLRGIEQGLLGVQALSKDADSEATTAFTGLTVIKHPLPNDGVTFVPNIHAEDIDDALAQQKLEDQP